MGEAPTLIMASSYNEEGKRAAFKRRIMANRISVNMTRHDMWDGDQERPAPINWLRSKKRANQRGMVRQAILRNTGWWELSEVIYVHIGVSMCASDYENNYQESTSDYLVVPMALMRFRPFPSIDQHWSDAKNRKVHLNFWWDPAKYISTSRTRHWEISVGKERKNNWHGTLRNGVIKTIFSYR